MAIKIVAQWLTNITTSLYLNPINGKQYLQYHDTFVLRLKVQLHANRHRSNLASPAQLELNENPEDH